MTVKINGEVITYELLPEPVKKILKDENGDELEEK